MYSVLRRTASIALYRGSGMVSIRSHGSISSSGGGVGGVDLGEGPAFCSFASFLSSRELESASRTAALPRPTQHAMHSTTAFPLRPLEEH